MSTVQWDSGNQRSVYVPLWSFFNRPDPADSPSVVSLKAMYPF
jgi:hypothetical protein